MSINIIIEFRMFISLLEGDILLMEVSGDGVNYVGGIIVNGRLDLAGTAVDAYS